MLEPDSHMQRQFVSRQSSADPFDVISARASPVPTPAPVVSLVSTAHDQDRQNDNDNTPERKRRKTEGSPVATDVNLQTSGDENVLGATHGQEKNVLPAATIGPIEGATTGLVSTSALDTAEGSMTTSQAELSAVVYQPVEETEQEQPKTEQEKRDDVGTSTVPDAGAVEDGKEEGNPVGGDEPEQEERDVEMEEEVEGEEELGEEVHAEGEGEIDRGSECGSGSGNGEGGGGQHGNGTGEGDAEGEDTGGNEGQSGRTTLTADQHDPSPGLSTPANSTTLHSHPQVKEHTPTAPLNTDGKPTKVGGKPGPKPKPKSELKKNQNQGKSKSKSKSTYDLGAEIDADANANANADSEGGGEVNRETTPKSKGKKASHSTAPVSASTSASATGSAQAGKKGTKAKGKTKVDELKSAATKPRSNSVSTTQNTPSPAPTTPTKSTFTAPGSASGLASADATPNPSPDKNAVYCICRKPYADEEEDITMLGCESCDNWFHPACVGLTEAMVELLDVYICKRCERSTAQRTIYKQVCKREGCMKSVAGSTSKFCSSACAFQHSSSLISGMTNKNTLRQLAKTFISYPPPQLGVKVISHRPSTPTTTGPKAAAPVPPVSTPESDSDKELDALRDQVEKVQNSIKLVKARQEILRQAIEQCETLTIQPQSLTANGSGHGHGAEDDDEQNGKRGKKKKSGGVGNKDDKPCGWIKRLAADDGEIQQWADKRSSAGVTGTEGHLIEVDIVDGGGIAFGLESGGEDQGICYNGRRKCDRHQGWQKTISVLLDVELTGLERTHQSLIEYQENLKSSHEARQTSHTVRNEFLERKSSLR